MANEKITRKELEKAINDSEFFNLKRDNNQDVYDAVRRKLIEEIYTYVFNVFPITRDNEFNLEIMKTISGAFKNYNRNAGSFINYFNRAMKLTIERTKKNRAYEERCGGMVIDKEKRLVIAKIFKFAEIKNYDVTDEVFLKKIIKLLHLNISPAEVLSLNNLRVVSEMTEESEDGERTSVFDSIADTAPSPEERAVTEDARKKFLSVFENIYQESRAASKERNSLVLTYILLFESAETGEEITDGKTQNFFERYSFIDERVLNAFYSGEKLTQKDIAQMAGVSAVAITKAKNLLLEELKVKLKQGAVFNS